LPVAVSDVLARLKHKSVRGGIEWEIRNSA
jgi:hypothetical protein